MSYCVNCGVELAKSEKHCPLCGTEVLNPKEPWKEPEIRSYPRRMELILDHLNRRYAAKLMSVFLCIPMLVALLCDLILDMTISWSAYVIAADLLVIVWVVLPLYFRRYRLLTFLGLDCLATALFLLIVCLVSGGDWFLPLGLPLILTVTVLLLGLSYLFRLKPGRDWINQASLSALAIGVLSVVVELVVDLYLYGTVWFGWAPYVLLSCLALAAALQIVRRQKRLREEIIKRMFY